MSEVCRVRLTGVYESPAVLAPFIPLPRDGNDTVCNDSSPGGSAPKVIDSHTLTGPEYIIKLYDPRCSVNVREQFDKGRPYSMEKAVAYHKYHRFQPAPYLSELFMDIPDWPRHPWTESDTGLFEAWLEVDATRTFERELSVYDLLIDLQGSVIPKVFDAVSFSPPFTFPDAHSVKTGTNDHDESTKDIRGASPTGSDHEEDTLDGVDLTRLAAGHRIFGILMEFVPGVSLRSFIRSCLSRPELRKEIASIADEAVALILKLGSFPLLNRDVRLDNMLVRQSFIATLGLEAAEVAGSTVRTFKSETASLSDPSPPQRSFDDRATPTMSRCIAIDFGQSRFRYNDETDEQWRCAKLFDDEESAMADALAWQMRESFKETLGSGKMLDEESLDLAEQACSEEQQALWSYKLVAPWYRKLSPEEQKAYDEDPWWGQHPRNRSHE